MQNKTFTTYCLTHAQILTCPLFSGSSPPGQQPGALTLPFSSSSSGCHLLTSHRGFPLLALVQFGFMRLDQTHGGRPPN